MKQTIEQRRAFWQNEIHLWKCTRDITWARWCAAREINPKDMPLPLYDYEQKKEVTKT